MKIKFITLLALAWTTLASAQTAGIYGGQVDDITFSDPDAGIFAVFVSTNGQATVVGYDVDSFQNYNGQAGGVAAQFNVAANGNWNFSSNNTIYGVSGSGSIGPNGSFSGTLNFTNGDSVQLNGSLQSPLGTFQNAAGYYGGTFSGTFGGQPISGPVIGVLSANGQMTFSSFVNGALNDGGQGQFGSNNQFITTNLASGTTVSGTLTNATLKIGGTSSNSSGSATWTLSRSNYVLQVATTNLPAGTTTVPYSQTLSAYGGPTNYSWGIISGGLPAGLSLSSGGVISGTPTTAVTTNFTVQVTNAASVTATQALSLVIYTFSTSVTFAVTPAAVSNTYPGTITLQANNLATGETVVVQKYLDLNTNGVVDGGDLLVQQFNLTDGQAGMVIGGVTNVNVPGDLNATNGAITATLNFQNGDFMQNIIGNFLVKLSSPVGHFTPITNQFIITNFPWAQKFTGTVVSNGTSVTLPNALVLLCQPEPSSGGPWEGAVANNAGSYTISAPPGTYSLVAFSSNCVANMGTPPVLTLAASQIITTNLTLTNATASISGTNVDASNSSIRLPGVLVLAQSANGLTAVTFTDTNGFFSVPVTAGTWAIKAGAESLLVHGYLGAHGTAVAAGATGVTLAYPQATALIYGSVTNNLGNPFVGIDVYATENNNNLYETDVYTDANGKYVLGVLDLGGSDSWWMQANGDDQLTNYVFSEETIDGVVNAGQAVLQNFTGILATNYITGWLRDNFGNPIAGVEIYDYTEAAINGLYYQGNGGITAANGNYSMNVANGIWDVGVANWGDSTSLPGNYLEPADQTVGITNNNGLANFTATLLQLQVTTFALPDGAIDGAYSQQLSAVYGQTPYSWSLISGSLPSGLTLATNGLISGTPTVAGTASFTVKVTDALSATATEPLTLTVLGPNLVMNGDFETGDFTDWTSSGNFDDCDINSFYAYSGTYGAELGPVGSLGYLSQTLSTTPGASYLLSFWLDSPDGETPNEFLVSWNGNILLDQINLPAIGWTNIQFVVTATGTSTMLQFGFMDDPSFLGLDDISVTMSQPAPPAVMTTLLSSGTTNVPYNSQQLTANGGQPPYSWSLASGALPPGLSLSASGLISGTPTVAGTSNFVVQVTDSSLATATQALSVVIYTFSTSVTFSVTPTAVSNFYNGIITLQVGGLASGETVRVEKFRDNNGNGVIDAGETEVQQFQLTDGQASVFYDGITAVTNFNVPGDLTPADGAITAQLHPALSGVPQLTVAQYAFRLSSPAGHFAPITNIFNVTNSAYAQWFTGNVVCSGTNVPHALAYLLTPPAGPNMTVIAGALADGNGAYRLNAPPGTYRLWVFKNGFVGDVGNGPVIALGANTPITTNLSLPPATCSISGRFVDAANTNAGLPRVNMQANSANGLMTVGFTDGGGNFTMSATTNAWGVFGVIQSLDSQGLLGLQARTPANTTNGSVAGVTIALARGTALVYGTVKDAQNHPLSGVQLFGNQNDGIGPYVGDAATDQNGNYAMVVNDAGVWNAGIRGNNPAFPNYLWTNYLWTAELGDTAFANGQAVQWNFTALLATNHVTGNVQDSNGNPIAGVGVWASTTINSANFFQYVDTDVDGNYSLNVGNGNWNISINCNGGSDSLDNILGSGNYQCPDNQNITINNDNATNNFIVLLCGGVQILTTNLPDGQVGTDYGAEYDFYLQALDCNDSYNWSLNDPEDFPSGMGIDSDGFIWGTPATDGTYYFSVHVDDGNGLTADQDLSLYIAPGSAPGPGPAPTQNLFVAAGDGNIYEYTTNGAQSVFASGLSGDEEGLAFDGAGNLFVSDAGNGAIYKFTTNGVRSTFASGLNAPRGLAFDEAGNLYEADAGSGNIYKFTPSGAGSTFASGLGWPMSLAFDSAGNLYEADWDSGNIYKFTTNGVQSTFVSGLNGPWGLAFDGAGNLFETDFGNNEIHKITTNGVSSVFATGLSEPEGMAFDSAGNLFEANQGSGYVYEFTTSGARSTFASGLNNPAALTFKPASQPPPDDVLLYFVTKMESFLQTNATNVVPDTGYGPFNAVSEIIQSYPDSVPIAIADLPSGVVKGFPLGSSDIELQVFDNFASQSALDAVYTNGNYTFAMATIDNGFQFPVLAMPVAVYPAAVQVSNFAAAQAINPFNPFALQWSNPPDATANDLIWVFIVDTNGTTVFSTPDPSTNSSAAISGTTTSVLIPTNTFQYDHAYTGFINFIRVTSVNTTAYPGATGLTLVAVRTRLSLAAPSVAPAVSHPAKLSGTQFGFQLSGLQGQNYTILATTNVSLPMSDWVTVLITNLSTSPVFIQDNQATNKQRFYRVLFGP